MLEIQSALAVRGRSPTLDLDLFHPLIPDSSVCPGASGSSSGGPRSGDQPLRAGSAELGGDRPLSLSIGPEALGFAARPTAPPPADASVPLRWREQPVAALLLLLIQAYRRWLSPLLGPRCRFIPSCSAYSLEAIRRHGPWRGSWLTVKRLLRCHPFTPCGCDPVPD